MTPQPPRLSERVPSLAERELFFIVKHGVKIIEAVQHASALLATGEARAP